MRSMTMRFIRILSALSLAAVLVSCGAKTPEVPPRGDSCVLDAGDYAIRVRRGVSEIEFVAPENVRGVVVRFGGDGGCEIDTTRSLGRASETAGGSADGSADSANGTAADSAADSAAGTDGLSGEYPGVVIPLADGSGYRDWLVLAYPEDFATGAAPSDNGTLSFAQDGAEYVIAPDGSCSVTRGGLTRNATRTDD